MPTSVDEQHAISTVLEDVDDEVDRLNHRLAKACAVKQGMMQQLLTGRTRLPVQEGAA
jgi:type I restriction enzyme S subunit